MLIWGKTSNLLCLRVMTLTALIGLGVSGCNIKAVEFEGHVTPLIIKTLPTPMVFTTPGPLQETKPATMQAAKVATTIVESVVVEPKIVTLCTTDALYIRARPGQSSDKITLIPPGTEVIATGDEAQADGYTWFEIALPDGTKGWSASDWLQEGECSHVFGGADTPTIIELAYVCGYDWMDEDSADHYAIDLHSAKGNATIYSPYSDQVVGSDSCKACLENDLAAGNALGQFDLDYNYGYGAIIIVEYAYSDLSEDEMKGLAEDGIELKQGTSIYMMIGHLNPNANISESGTILNRAESMAFIGNSGNSKGDHAHVEVAINDSGLTPGDGQLLVRFWLETVVERVYQSPNEHERRGNRIDPSPLFDMP